MPWLQSRFLRTCVLQLVLLGSFTCAVRTGYAQTDPPQRSQNPTTPESQTAPASHPGNLSQPTQTNPASQPEHQTTLGGRPCLPVAEAALSPNQEICVSAHVYDIVELSDGTRFLDVCPPATPDSECRFTILCQAADRDDVGDLDHFRNQEIHLRGMVLSTHGRMGIVLSHVRQFSGGPQKFRPNPRLLHGFDGQSAQTPLRDPNLRASGHHRSFMNTRDTEPLPGGKKS